MNNMVDLSHYVESKPHYLKRVAWYAVNNTIFRCFPGSAFRYVRNAMLKAFGAEIPWKSMVYSSCDVWAPWNLKIGKYSCVGPHVQLYNKSEIIIGDNVTVSQGAFLCTAGHDIYSKSNALVSSPIIIGNEAWIAADSFVNMGVHIGEGAVVGARACVFRDVAKWMVVGGNPAKEIKERVIVNP